MSAYEDGGDDAPAFIGNDWLFDDGWSFRGAPPVDLADTALLASERPWDRLLCVLAQGKRGDFSHVDVLTELVADERPHPLFLATMYASAAIGDSAAQSALVRWIDSEWFTQATAAVVLTGDLSVIDTLLARRRGAEPEIRETMEGAVSQLLELEPERFYETGLSDDDYDALVRAEVAALTARHGANLRFALGAPLRTRTLVGKLAEMADLERESLDDASATLGSLAFHLETLTGLPSIGVVTVDAKGSEVVDRSRLGRFIEAVEKWDAKHRPRSGRRLFFGHAVPEAP